MFERVLDDYDATLECSDALNPEVYERMLDDYNATLDCSDALNPEMYERVLDDYNTLLQGLLQQKIIFVNN